MTGGLVKPAVLFDFDGTLFFSTELINIYSFNRALADMGRPAMTYDQLMSTIGDTMDGIAQSLLGTDDALQKQAFLKRIMAHLPAAVDKYAAILPDVIDLLKTMSKAVPLAICSNANPHYILPLLKRFDIEQYFSHIWYYHEGYNKASAIPVVMEALGVTEAVMIGDRFEDIEAGKANGCVTVALKNGIGPQDAEGADYTVSNHKQMLSLLLSICK
jgi:HAD superfamily hydrolase (TIGR01549 family)